MRSPPADLLRERLVTALAEAWQLRAASLEYLPEGGGGHHWLVTGADGVRHFVTVDDLDDKDWLGTLDTRRWQQGLASTLARLPRWLDALD